MRLQEETKDALLDVAYAISRDEIRPALCAVWLNRGWAIATDAYRASIHPAEDWTDEPVPFWLHDLAESNGSVKVAEGVFPKPTTFPEWWTFVKPTPHRAVFDRAELMASLRSLTITKDGQYPEPVWFFAHRDVGRARFSLITTTDNASIDARLGGWLPTFGVQRSYLLDALRAVECHEVAISARDPKSPVVLAEADDEDPEGGFEVVMPCFGSYRFPLPALVEGKS